MLFLFTQFKAEGHVDWTKGRANDDGEDLNRDFPNIDEQFFEERQKKNGRNHNLQYPAGQDMVSMSSYLENSK